MPASARPKQPDRRAADDIMHGLRELAKAVAEGAPLENQFTVSTVNLPRASNQRGR
jgi:hypothetical protein